MLVYCSLASLVGRTKMHPISRVPDNNGLVLVAGPINALPRFSPMCIASCSLGTIVLYRADVCWPLDVVDSSFQVVVVVVVGWNFVT